MAAAPTESEAHLAGQHLEKPRREQDPSTEGRPLLRQHLGLGLAGEQGKGEEDPENSQYRAGNDRLHYDAIAEPRGQLAHGPAEAMKEPASAGAERDDGKCPGEFGCPHGHGGEVRQPRTAASHLVEQHERPQRPGHGEQVHRRFDRFGNLGRGNHRHSGRAAPMPTPVGIVRIAEQRRRQAEQRGREDRRQNGRRARVRQLAHLGAHELESVPHPAAKPRHHAGEASLGPDAAAKQKRQKRANEHSAQMPILIAPGFLHLGEHRVHIIGVRPHVLLKQSNGNAAHNAEGKRVHDSGHPYRRQPRRRLHPQ